MRWAAGLTGRVPVTGTRCSIRTALGSFAASHATAQAKRISRCGLHIRCCLQGVGSQDAAQETEGQLTEIDDDDERFPTTVGVIDEVEPEEAQVDIWGESTTGNLHIVHRLRDEGVVNVFGLSNPEDIIRCSYDSLQECSEVVLRDLGVTARYPHNLPHRAIFCSRTLNMRPIRAIGFDMDYTLINYDVGAWEGRAYAYGLDALREMGCPVDGLKFDPDLVIRGLIVDRKKGNLVKVDRFGLVKRAMHGTRMMTPSEIKDVYGRDIVNLRNEERWVFLNTLFSVSEAVMYMQMVERMDRGMIPPHVGAVTYNDLYSLVAKALYRTHVEGKLKAEIIQEPERYVELDPEIPQTLIDMKDAGKVLMLITNSDYMYTNKMMSFAFDRFLPETYKGWRDLFDMVIILARKPDFFNYNMSLYEIVTDSGLMRPALKARRGGLYCGGSARMIEKALGVEGDEILYVGDHIYTDAALAKLNFKWRTCLVVKELEHEIEALSVGRAHRAKLKELLDKKEVVGDVFNQLRLQRQRFIHGHNSIASFDDEDAVDEDLAQLLVIMEELDEAIGPMVDNDGFEFNARWGYLSRAGVNDKSQLARQIEKYADVYTSRVSNFLRYTPFMYFRSPTQSVAHDRDMAAHYRRAYAAASQANAALGKNGTGAQ